MAHRPKHRRTALLKRALTGRCIRTDLKADGTTTERYQLARIKAMDMEGFVKGSQPWARNPSPQRRQPAHRKLPVSTWLRD